MRVSAMIAAHPHVRGATNDILVHAVEKAIDCAETCRSCADACLGESMVADLVQCIRLNLDCADVCAATGAVAARRSGSNEALIVAMLRTCADACRACGAECIHHAVEHEHCRICAEACRTCEAACRAAADTITPDLP